MPPLVGDGVMFFGCVLFAVFENSFFERLPDTLDRLRIFFSELIPGVYLFFTVLQPFLE